MTLYLAAFLIGVIAGFRAMTAPASVSWAARLGALKLGGWLAYAGHQVSVAITTIAALGELYADKQPTTPSRKAPVPFAVRVLSGAGCGAIIAASSWPIGAVAGALGAVAGTLGGAAIRGKLAVAFGEDFRAALLEDAVALGGAALVFVLLVS